MLPPRLAARWAAAQIKDLVATKTPHHTHTPTTLHVVLCFLQTRVNPCTTHSVTTEVVLDVLLVGSKRTIAHVLQHRTIPLITATPTSLARYLNRKRLLNLEVVGLPASCGHVVKLLRGGCVP